VLIYYLLILMIPFAMYPPFFRVIPGYSLIKIVGAMAFCYAVFYLFIGRNKKGLRPFETKGAKLFLLFVLFVFLSGAIHYTQSTDEPIFRYLFYLALFFTTYILVNTSKTFERVYFLIIVSMLLACYRGFKEYLLYRGIYASFRPGSIIGDPNYFALSLIFTLPLSYYIWSYFRSKWIRFFGLFASIVFLLMILITASRGAIIGLIVMFAVMVIESKKKLRTILLVSFCVLFLFSMVPQRIWDRLSGITSLAKVVTSTRTDSKDDLKDGSKNDSKDDSIPYGDRLSTQKRYKLFLAGVRMTLDNWVDGVGVGNFRSRLQAYFPGPLDKVQLAHNMYIELSAELGLFGILLFVLMLVFVFKSLFKIERLARQNEIVKVEYFAKALKFGLIGFLTGAFFLTSQYERTFWLGIFLAISLWRVMKVENPDLFKKKKYRPGLQVSAEQSER
jgi:O-antigen ligase